MNDFAKEAEDLVDRLRIARPEGVKRKFAFITRAVEFNDVDLEDAAMLVETTIEKVSSSLEAVNVPMRVLDVIITPLQTSVRHAGRDAQGDYDFNEGHRGVIITLKLG